MMETGTSSVVHTGGTCHKLSDVVSEVAILAYIDKKIRFSK
jgi:hypothetical protein